MMSVKTQQFSQIHKFICHKDVHRIIFARGDKAVSFHIHPVAAGLGALVALILGLSYLGATGYLIFRDNILSAIYTHQSRLHNQYEDQMASLRIEIDRITSRQLLDQHTVENKVNRLLGLTESITARNKSVQSLVEAASAAGIPAPDANLAAQSVRTPDVRNDKYRLPSPRPRPPLYKSSAQANLSDHATIVSGQRDLASAYGAKTSGINTSQAAITRHIRTPTLSELDFNQIEKNLHNEEANQVHQIKLMASKTSARARKISTALRSIGATPPVTLPNSLVAIGGPFEEAKPNNIVAFNSSILALEENLIAFNELKSHLERYPLGQPLKDARISSHFGRRIDPFLGRYANHAGVDFTARYGTPVLATGPGRVLEAGRNGGYGLMVEVEHTGGVTTRYAHLSQVHVQQGDHVEAGVIIGRVGSTGRSTGPHLHYETRVSDKAVNPQRFFNAGRNIKTALD